MTEKEYISRDEFVSQELTGSRSDSADRLQTQWYGEVIKHYAGNKLRLIEESPELAYKMFARYNDQEGFELIAASQTSDDEVKRNARMQLESLVGDRLGPSGKGQQKDPAARFRDEIPNRGDVSHRGRLPITGDIAYEGQGNSLG